MDNAYENRMDPNRKLKSRGVQEVKVSMKPMKGHQTLQPWQSFAERQYICRSCWNIVTVEVAGPAKRCKSGARYRWRCPYCGEKMNILLPLKANSFIVAHHYPPTDFVLHRLLKLKLRPRSCIPLNFEQAGKLMKSLNSEDPWTRRESARILGKAKLELAIPGLKKLLNDPYPKIQAVAAHALASMGDITVLPNLLRMFASGNSEVLFDVVSALEYIGDQSCIPLMIEEEKKQGIMMSNFIRAATRKIIKRFGKQK